MADEFDGTEAIRRFATAVGNITAELVSAGADPLALAASLRIQAGAVEAPTVGQNMEPTEQELVTLARRAHEFINTLQVAGIEEHVAVLCLVNASIERVTRLHGAAGAARWLRGMAELVDHNAESFEATARHH